MFNLKESAQTIVRQGEKIMKQNDRIFAKTQVIKELCEENSILYLENKALEEENSELIEAKDIAERRNVEYARIIKNITDELNVNQYNSVINLQNKIKSMLTMPGKHCS
mgnify:FL=1|nr:MAG TPA: hypothetical protein [Caudoviricetes sp.]